MGHNKENLNFGNMTQILQLISKHLIWNECSKCFKERPLDIL